MGIHSDLSAAKKFLADTQADAGARAADSMLEAERESIIDAFVQSAEENRLLVDAALAEFPALSWSSILLAEPSVKLRNALGQWLAANDLRWPGATVIQAMRIPGLFTSKLVCGANGILQFMCFDCRAI